MHLLWFWHVKNAEVDKDWAEIDDKKDSYDRQDNFNVIGLATYLFFTAKQSICSITGSNSQLRNGQEYARINDLSSPIANDFMFDSMMPLISYSLRAKSATI